MFGQKPETDIGGIISAQFNKKLNKHFELGFEEEVRLVSNNTGFNRLSSGMGLEYTIIKRLKCSVFYNYMYMYDGKNNYESRHRYYINLSYKRALNRKLTLAWRTRFQGTYRDEDRGMYKINPKYVLRNRMEAEYSILGTRWKPNLSMEASYSLNDPMGNEFYKLRFQGGTSWRLDRTTYLDFFVRADKYLTEKNQQIISLGVGYKKNF